MPLASVSLFCLSHSIVDRLRKKNNKDVKIDPATSSLAGVHPETNSQHGEEGSADWDFLYFIMTGSDKQVGSVSGLNHTIQVQDTWAKT